MADVSNWIDFYANLYGVNPELYRQIINVESKYNPKVISPKGAIGYSQLMPATAAELGVNPYNPEENIKGGAKYLAQQQKAFGPVMGLAAYNWGPGNVKNYLAGNIKSMPEETENYLKRLGPIADPNYYHAPMNAQGMAQTPEVLPVSNPTPPPQIPETKKMDDYSQMTIFNPYIQMALGIMAGNSGMNKSQAFSNAMGGGLTALNAAQRSAAYDQQVKAQASRVRREDAQYEMMQNRARMQQEYFQKMLGNPNLSSEERKLAELGAMGNVDTGLDLFKTSMQGKYNEDRLELQEKIAELKKKQEENPSAVDVPEGHPLSGWYTKGGKLYDPRNIEVTGDKRNWATEVSTMAPEDAGRYSYSSYKDKNNPNRLINPQNFSNWIDQEGNYITESVPAEEAVKKGYRYVDDKERADYRAAKNQLDQIATQWDNLFGKEGVYSKAKGLKGNDLERFVSGIGTNIAGTGLGNDQTSIKVREFNKFVDRTLPTYAREVGHTGVLTQQDVDSVKPSIGMITPEYMKGKFFPDTEKEVKHGLKTLIDLYRSRGIVNKKLEKMLEEMEEQETSTGPNIWDNTPVGAFENGIRVYRK